MQITFAESALPTEGAVVVGVLEGRVLTSAAHTLERHTNGALTRAIAASHFSGQKEQALILLAPTGLSLTRIILVGLGKATELDPLALEVFGGVAMSHLLTANDIKATVMVDGISEAPLPLATMAAHVACGARLRAYRFDKYRTKRKKEDKKILQELQVRTLDVAAAYKKFEELNKIIDGVFLARTLSSEPANVIYPESFATEVRKLDKFGLSIEVFNETALRHLGMNALLAVGSGSARESMMIVLRWLGAPDSEERPLALVGKGVTFDSGGLSIKPSAGMGDMKWDMAGAGVVVGVMQALAARQVPLNVVGVVGMVENMPSGTAQRPGDIIISASGQTIEVLNTDAEGRLVLADALWYVQEHYHPVLIVDIATLTGAIVTALGAYHAGLFTNNDALADKLATAGKAVGERLWRLPLSEFYDKQIESDAADMKNTGDREAGAITAAQFLQRFIGSVPWAHLDIAGVTWSKQDTATVPKGATAFGVRLLERFITTYYHTQEGIR